MSYYHSKSDLEKLLQGNKMETPFIKEQQYNENVILLFMDCFLYASSSEQV